MKRGSPMRESWVHIRLTKDEKLEISQQADLAGITLSEYMRKRIFGHVVKSKADLRILSELRRQGGLLKDLYNKTKGTFSEEFSRAIRANEKFYQNLLHLISLNEKISLGEDSNQN